MAADPRNAAPPAAPATSTAAEEPVDLLIVDDRPENLLALEAILEPLGQRLVRAHSGDEALRHLLTRDFACILLDVQMPGMSGFETARLIKARERTRYIPIIFLTAINTDEAYVFEGYSVGAVDYLAKPFQPGVLRSKVSVFVELYRKQRQLADQETQLRDAERRELELRFRAEALEREAQVADELKALNEELREQQDALERAMTARNRFYASMSHELRTPINAIIGYNTLLLDHIYGPLNDKQRHGLQRTHQAAKHLLELVNDVLDLSKIEAGKIELSMQPVHFPALIDDLFVTVRPLADEHEATLELECDVPAEGRGLTIVSDPRRVRQILLNLLSNAIKFGREKPITVVVAPRRADDDREDGVVISVSDRGEGISPQDLPRIFDEFVQLSNSQQLGGTGLGLPISKRLAQLLGGELEVESTVGEGTTFRLMLPASADDERRRARAEAEAPIHVEHDADEAPRPRDGAEPRNDGGTARVEERATSGV
jgi:signal transduction histidine kinase